MSSLSETKRLNSLQLENTTEAASLFGPNDAFLKVIEDKLNVSIVTRGEDILVSGELNKAEMVEETLFVLLKLVRKGIKISE